MREGETELGMVRRHVEVGARLIAKQRTLIARLRKWDLPIVEAEALLILLENVQRQHQEHLARLVRRLPSISDGPLLGVCVHGSSFRGSTQVMLASSVRPISPDT